MAGRLTLPTVTVMNTPDSSDTTPPSARPGPTPLPMLALLALALLGVPRVVLHDLGLLAEGSGVNLLFVVVPPLIWILVAVLRPVPRPFRTLLTLGVLYGAMLAVTHQVLWSTAFAGATPALGGNLAGLDPFLQVLILRGAAVVSSLVTGTAVGALSGLLAAGPVLLGRRRRPDPKPVR